MIPSTDNADRKYYRRVDLTKVRMRSRTDDSPRNF